MIKLEKTDVVGWEAAIRGMRNPMNSWDKSDTYVCIAEDFDKCEGCDAFRKNDGAFSFCTQPFIIGPNDHELMMKLRNAGTDHRKFMRMIVVYLDITAPLYWWKEFDTYKVGTVVNSCSTMYKIHAKEFALEDFSHDHMTPYSLIVLEDAINALNELRAFYLNWNSINDATRKVNEWNDKKDIWWQMIQLLPSSYNQKRTAMLSYEVLANIYFSRKNHKLDEWIEFCKWIEGLPYSELITGTSLNDIPICNEIMEEAKRRVTVEEDLNNEC